MTTITAPLPPGTGALDLAGDTVHEVCCDANKALCGADLAGGADRYVEDATSCTLCALLEGLPCGVPGCDVGEDTAISALVADLGAAAADPMNGCTDPLCPGSSDSIPDPTAQLCPGCRAAAFEELADRDR